MDIKSVKNAASRFAHKAAFNIKKYSPEILTYSSIGFGVATVVLTWIAARKIDKALEEPKAIIANAHAKEITPEYTKKDQQRDILKGYRKGAWAVVKTCGPAFLMGASTVTCILTSHRILSGRYAESLAANGILLKEFSDYREGVIKDYGKEVDQKLRFGDKMETVEKTVTDENGKETTVTETCAKKDYDSRTLARIFDEYCPAWKKDVLYNINTVKQLQSQFNRDLEARYVIRLNDIYKEFGWPKTQAGEQYGWVYDPKDPFKSVIDFGLPFNDKEWMHKMIAENQRSFWLDFNCTKIIYDKIPYPEA